MEGQPPVDAPRWAFMWGLSFAIFGSLKLLSWVTTRSDAPAWKHLAYLLGWPGMDAAAFLDRGRVSVKPVSRSELIFAISKLALGVTFLWLVTPAVSGHADLAGWMGMIGIVFVLHFGLFHLLSCLWRSMGIAARPIMNWPIVSQSISEFWGRRWNLAFRDLTHRFLFQPLIRRLGPVGALLVGFFVSGVLHDLVISWPAEGGWGLPTGYFLLQGIGVLIERSKSGHRCGLGRGLAGRVFCWFVIVLPSPLLFHSPFNRRVIQPFLSAIGALS